MLRLTRIIVCGSQISRPTLNPSRMIVPHTGLPEAIAISSG